MNNEKVVELRKIQAKAEAIRLELGIGAPGEIIYQADLDVTADETVLAEADGFGGATVRVIEGNYPVDYITKFEKFFPSESEAETVAEEVACSRRTPREVLAA